MATHIPSTSQLDIACADDQLPDNLDGESLGNEELADIAEDDFAGEVGRDINALEFNLVSVSRSINWERAAARGLNFAWLFSGCQAQHEDFASAFQHSGIQPTRIGMEGNTLHMLLDEAGFEKLVGTLSEGKHDGVVLTPPTLTFSSTIHGKSYRTSDKKEMNGRKGLSGPDKERVRIETLAMIRTAAVVKMACNLGIPTILVLPFGEEYAFNPVRHEAIMEALSTADDAGLQNIQLSKGELRGGGLSIHAFGFALPDAAG